MIADPRAGWSGRCLARQHGRCSGRRREHISDGRWVPCTCPCHKGKKRESDGRVLTRQDLLELAKTWPEGRASE